MILNLKLTEAPSLSSRLVRVLSLLSFSIVMLFTGAILLISYAFEDILLNDRLKQAHEQIKNGGPTPNNMTLIQTHKTLEPDLLQKLRYLELDSNQERGEFNVGNHHYHYLVTEQGTLLYDTTEAAIIQRALDDIFLILCVLLIPSALLTYWVAHLTAKHALKPFHQLREMFLKKSSTYPLERKTFNNIQEVDVREIAEELHRALHQKAALLAQQESFNQGMAHELRTPLQVMQNSIELLAHTQNEIVSVPAFKRLGKSVQRMQRLSNALLWLTSQHTYDCHIDAAAIIRKTINSMQDLMAVHQVKTNIEVKHPCPIAMPEEVLELLVFNLFNNVVHHASAELEQRHWSILIDQTKIQFLNAIPKENVVQANEHFGIGLTLVTKLAQRFNIGFHLTEHNEQFIITLSTHSH
ncbi:HAMP domain-containing histidine kinase [Pseudoalteromonas sp. MMG013]|uniref:sensor histidine kinase n=1 Tax=Pseudoalteromonas sp. MMG013 TaxID=2822687 RepID=UPI001B370FE4|nr:HAMP domain-containing sensor histidine kinase [Pseudoalteromonas sp. MMG013]MBQ4863233.1 HAMP domain-containing histidine kinase [Pseudoalteromonas sp. MMG013]